MREEAAATGGEGLTLFGNVPEGRRRRSTIRRGKPARCRLSARGPVLRIDRHAAPRARTRSSPPDARHTFVAPQALNRLLEKSENKHVRETMYAKTKPGHAGLRIQARLPVLQLQLPVDLEATREVAARGSAARRGAAQEVPQPTPSSLSQRGAAANIITAAARAAAANIFISLAKRCRSKHHREWLTFHRPRYTSWGLFCPWYSVCLKPS